MWGTHCKVRYSLISEDNLYQHKCGHKSIFLSFNVLSTYGVVASTAIVADRMHSLCCNFVHTQRNRARMSFDEFAVCTKHYLVEKFAPSRRYVMAAV